MEQTLAQLQLKLKQAMFKDRFKKHSGFTLMDIVIGVTFLSFAFIATFRITNDLQRKLNERDLQIRATSIANSTMSVIRSVNFDENWPSGIHTPANNLGMDVSSLYDDIDDFMLNPASAMNFGTSDDGFGIAVSVYYVDPTTTPPNTTVALTGSNYSNYKRVDITVAHAELPNPVVLSAIVTPNDY